MVDHSVIDANEEEVTEKPKRKKAVAANETDALTVRRTVSAKKKAMGNVPMVKVRLPIPPDIADDETVVKKEFVTHNGYKYEIKLGYTVELPVPVFMAMKQGKYKNVNILA